MVSQLIIDSDSINTDPEDGSFKASRSAVQLSKEILTLVLMHQRLAGPHKTLASKPCLHCQESHLPKVRRAIIEARPITFVLPAFPGKSPNPLKVLGVLPDMAEQRALIFLHKLCLRIKELYSPGAHVILCSDGRVFSDILGMKESSVTDYQREIDRLIASHNLENLKTFNLDDVYQHLTFDQMRSALMQRFGKPLSRLRKMVQGGGSFSQDQESIAMNRMYCGMTRFLLEDASHPGQVKSRSALQKQSRKRAYEVIQRSDAWSQLIAEKFPHAVRLSIHPQACGAEKLGIRLMGKESWMTPWHGVAVEVGGRFELMKRFEAERLGAHLVYNQDGRPSHFRLGSKGSGEES